MTTTWLVLKSAEMLEECNQLFGSSINITTEGKRHLGAAIGSQQYKEEYINEKVAKWKTTIEALADIAKSQPHAAYAGYLHAEQHKYTYFKRTIIEISDNLKPIDNAIDNLFIPTLFGCEINQTERDIVSLPIKEGGLGIRKVSENCQQSLAASVKLTKPLTDKILQQSDELPPADDVVQAKLAAVQEVKTYETQRSAQIKSAQTPQTQRTLEQLSQPGASSWLGVLPSQTQSFNLTKAEFQDALCLRYEKPIKNLPSKCPCNKPFDVTHALNCKRGGFVNIRHNNIRDFECSMLKIVAQDVQCEPTLQPVVNKTGYKKSAILVDGASLDVRARGFWRNGQNAFFDVRVTNTECDSQQNSSLKAILRKHENEKKLEYNRRVMEVEHGSFTPLVFTTSGVMSHECSVFHRSLAKKISLKRGDRYEEVMRYLRIKLSFLALKSTLLCLRGSRSHTPMNFSSDFGLALNELGV